MHVCAGAQRSYTTVRRSGKDLLRARPQLSKVSRSIAIRECIPFHSLIEIVIVMWRHSPTYDPTTTPMSSYKAQYVLTKPCTHRLLSWHAHTFIREEEEEGAEKAQYRLSLIVISIAIMYIIVVQFKGSACDSGSLLNCHLQVIFRNQPSPICDILQMTIPFDSNYDGKILISAR